MYPKPAIVLVTANSPIMLPGPVFISSGGGGTGVEAGGGGGVTCEVIFAAQESDCTPFTVLKFAVAEIAKLPSLSYV